MTQNHGFCGCCGSRYEAGEKMVVLTAALDARGRIAHASCVTKHNQKVEKALAKLESRKGYCYEGVEA